MVKTNPPRVAVGGRLKQAREVLGLSQADVCRRANVTANAYNQWEKGRRLINLFDAMTLADVLNFTLDWLYRGARETQTTPDKTTAAGWSEATSEQFVDFGDYFVPERQAQIETICSLIPDSRHPHVVELCCGEGLLSAALLAHHPDITVHAYDGSPIMLTKTAQRLDGFAGRYTTREIDIAAMDWRRFPWPVRAFVSSLAIHHLDGAGKQKLFADLAAALAPGGALVIADLIEPETQRGREVAARGWDQAVRARALELDGNEKAYEFFRDDAWNYYSDPSPDPIDQPSALLDQLKWLEDAGLENADVHWLKAGHAIFSAVKPG
jgi:tRNA (cmo5U34)-methyltransferase